MATSSRPKRSNGGRLHATNPTATGIPTATARAAVSRATVVDDAAAAGTRTDTAATATAAPIPTMSSRFELRTAGHPPRKRGTGQPRRPAPAATPRSPARDLARPRSARCARAESAPRRRAVRCSPARTLRAARRRLGAVRPPSIPSATSVGEARDFSGSRPGDAEPRLAQREPADGRVGAGHAQALSGDPPRRLIRAVGGAQQHDDGNDVRLVARGRRTRGSAPGSADG